MACARATSALGVLLNPARLAPVCLLVPAEPLPAGRRAVFPPYIGKPENGPQIHSGATILYLPLAIVGRRRSRVIDPAGLPP